MTDDMASALAVRQYLIKNRNTSLESTPEVLTNQTMWLEGYTSARMFDADRALSSPVLSDQIAQWSTDVIAVAGSSE